MKPIRCFAVLLLTLSGSATHSAVPLGEPGFQAPVVKIYGAGGVGRLEAYQTGLIASQEGMILTVDSTVLDEGEALVVFSNGDRTTGRLVASDPLSGAALLQIDGLVQPESYFDVSQQTPRPSIGTVVIAISNAFNIAQGNEPLSLQRGVVAGYISTEELEPNGIHRREGRVMLTDITTSNPGAAGGAVLGADGQLFGMIGVEARDASTGAWQNYVVPTDRLAGALARMRGSLAAPTESSLQNPTPPSVVAQRLRRELGISLAPRLSARTPPYVEHVALGSLAAQAGLRNDDLLTTVDGKMTTTIDQASRALHDALERQNAFEATVIREGQVFRIAFQSGGPGS